MAQNNFKMFQLISKFDNIDTNKKEIQTDSSDDEDETILPKIKTQSPTKYYGKRVSFDYHNLIKIEKISIRRASVLEKTQEKEISNIPSIVKFSNGIEEEIKENTNEIKPKEGKKKNEKKRSILKNTCYNENLDLKKIFDVVIFADLINLIENDVLKNSGDIKEILSVRFLEYFKKNQENLERSLIILKAVNQEYLRYIFKSGLDLSILMQILNTFNRFIEENIEFIINFLENLSKVQRFKFCVSCLMPSEKEIITNLFLALEKNIEQSDLSVLKKLYLI